MDQSEAKKEQESSGETEEQRLKARLLANKKRNGSKDGGQQQASSLSNKNSNAARQSSDDDPKTKGKAAAQSDDSSQPESSKKDSLNETKTVKDQNTSSKSNDVSLSSAPNSDHQEQDNSGGRQQKRERRRTDREHRRREGPPPSSRRGEDPYYGGIENNRRHFRPPHQDRGGGDRGRGRAYYHPPHDRDRRGGNRHSRYDTYQNSYDRQRSRSDTRPRRRGRSRSRSSSYSTGSESSRDKSGSRTRHQDKESHSTSRSRSRRSRSRSGSGSYRKRSHSASHREHSGERQRKRRRSYSSSDSSSVSSSSSDSSSSSSGSEHLKSEEQLSEHSKDQRTVFVSQLVMKATSKDIKHYFKKKVGCGVKEVILLRDRRTNRHKGCAYVQFRSIEDVGKAVEASGQQPDFQRFPILVKASEAEKNYIIPASSSTVTSQMIGGNKKAYVPLLDKDGRMIESQKVYVGSLDHSVSEEHLFAVFSQFGQLEKVSVQMDPTTRQSRGYAFLSFRDPKDANLAIQAMASQVLAGRPMKTGWANQTSTIPNVEIVKSDAFPDDAAERTQKAYSVLAQLMGTNISLATAATNNSASVSMAAEDAINAALGIPSTGQSTGGSLVPTVADVSANLSTPLGLTSASFASSEQASAPETYAAPIATSSLESVDNNVIGGSESPTRNLLVHNTFDKSEETEAGWEEELRQEFMEEVSKFGTVADIVVMSAEEGGKIYVKFDKVESAQNCASKFAGRWFDKRQLRVDFIADADVPISKEEE